jgi:hypothetical protein
MNARSIGMTLTLFAFGLLSAAAGEDTPYDQSLKQMLKTLERLTTALATVKDGATAEAARPELRKATMAWVEVKTKMAELPPPEPAEKTRLTKEYKGKIEAALTKFFIEVGRVRGLPAGKVVLDDIKAVAGPAVTGATANP